MTDISGRELRDNLSQVLRRVEAGERLRVTVGGRPVAELGPLPQPPRPRTMSWKDFVDRANDWRADPKLARDLSELLDLPPGA